MSYASDGCHDIQSNMFEYDSYLANFGFAVRVNSQTSRSGGTEGFYPPEVAAFGNSSGFKYDVFSIFMTLAHCFNFGNIAFCGQESNAMILGRLESLAEADHRVKDFTDWFEEDPDKRISLAAAIGRLEIMDSLNGASPYCNSLNVATIASCVTAAKRSNS